MKTVSLIYTPELAPIADEVDKHLQKKDCLVFKFNLEKEFIDVLWTNFIPTIKISDFVIPILFPVQKTNELYTDIRHFYESVGAMEIEANKAVLPIYLPAAEMGHDVKDEQVRMPRQFFSNIISLSWIPRLDVQENLKTLDSQIVVIKRLNCLVSPDNTSKPNIKEEIQFLISKSRFDDAVSKMNHFLLSTNNSREIRKQFLLVESQYSYFSKMETSGLYKTADIILEKNKFTSSFINILDEVED